MKITSFLGGDRHMVTDTLDRLSIQLSVVIKEMLIWLDLYLGSVR